MYKKPILIAEIGCNHMGNMDIAKALIKSAVIDCAVSYVKFQKRTPIEMLSNEQYHTAHPNPHHAYGNTYGAHREFLEFTLDQHKELKEYTESIGGIYSSSVWDMTSAKEIISLNPQLIKIPSAKNNHQALLEYICTEYSGEIHISLGMTTLKEEEELLNIFYKLNRNQDVVLYACTSGYPVPFEDVCLLEISRLKDSYGSIVKEIGFSGHHNGIAVDVAAYTLGAMVLERHFTLDRTWKGTDHAASLEPTGLKKLQRDLLVLHKALKVKSQEILPIEQVQREKLKG
ncbi:MAG: N-acetylneuraminate synthase family protein [Brevinema sp.]